MQETLRKLHEMKLYGLARSYEQRAHQPDHQDLSTDEMIRLLVDDEYLYRKNKRQDRLLKAAKIKFSSASLESLDYTYARSLNKSKVIQLQTMEWLHNHHNILITGPTGVGKSYLACALANWTCRMGYPTLYFRWPRLLGDILASKGAGHYLKHLAMLASVKLLVIDDFGLTPLTDTERKDLMEMIEDRYMTGSTLIASQLPLSDWHHAIGDPSVADAICDRLFHHAFTFELKGDSLRKSTLIPSLPDPIME